MPYVRSKEDAEFVQEWWESQALSAWTHLSIELKTKGYCLDFKPRPTDFVRGCVAHFISGMYAERDRAREQQQGEILDG